MNRTFDPAEFDSAIKDKDYIRIKNYIINAIRNNPGFRFLDGQDISEASEAFKKLWDMKEELPGLFSKYKLQNGEIEFDENKKEKWNQEYFIRQTFLLGENFCPTRFTNIKKIGQYLEKANFEDPQEVLEDSGNYTKNTSISEVRTANTSILPWVLLAFVLIAGITILVGIVAEIKWLDITGIVVLIVALCMFFINWVRRR